MTDWLTVAYFSIGSALLAVSIIGVAFSAGMPALGRWNRRFFVLFFSLLFLYIIVILLELISYSSPEMVKAQRVIILFEFLFFSVLTLMPMPFLLHCAKEDIKGIILAYWSDIFERIMLYPSLYNTLYLSKKEYFEDIIWPIFVKELGYTMNYNSGEVKRISK